MQKTGRNQKSSFRPDAQPANRPTCPRCGQLLAAITTTGPTDHVAQPCGCEIHDLTITMSTSYHDLTGFQRDALEAIARIERRNESPYGLAIKRELETHYDNVTHARLYQNLDDLKEAGAIEKSSIDKRTKAYELSQRGRGFLIDHLQVLRESIGHDTSDRQRAVADGGSA